LTYLLFENQLEKLQWLIFSSISSLLSVNFAWTWDFFTAIPTGILGNGFNINIDEAGIDTGTDTDIASFATQILTIISIQDSKGGLHSKWWWTAHALQQSQQQQQQWVNVQVVGRKFGSSKERRKEGRMIFFVTVILKSLFSFLETAVTLSPNWERDHSDGMRGRDGEIGDSPEFLIDPQVVLFVCFAFLFSFLVVAFILTNS
jgi:hypothetical protein